MRRSSKGKRRKPYLAPPCAAVTTLPASVSASMTRSPGPGLTPLLGQARRISAIPGEGHFASLLNPKELGILKERALYGGRSLTERVQLAAAAVLRPPLCSPCCASDSSSARASATRSPVVSASVAAVSR